MLGYVYLHMIRYRANLANITQLVKVVLYLRQISLVVPDFLRIHTNELGYFFSMTEKIFKFVDSILHEYSTLGIFLEHAIVVCVDFPYLGVADEFVPNNVFQYLGIALEQLYYLIVDGLHVQ